MFQQKKYYLNLQKALQQMLIMERKSSFENTYKNS